MIETSGEAVQTHFGRVDGIATVYWDPHASLVAVDNSGHVIGVESPAAMLDHEMSHALNGTLSDDVEVKLPNYDDLAEKKAIAVEDATNAVLGEVQRENHNGTWMYTDNPTMHSVGNTYKEMDTDGTTRSGGTFDSSVTSAEELSATPDLGGALDFVSGPVWSFDELYDNIDIDSGDYAGVAAIGAKVSRAKSLVAHANSNKTKTAVDDIAHNGTAALANGNVSAVTHTLVQTMASFGVPRSSFDSPIPTGGLHDDSKMIGHGHAEGPHQTLMRA